MDITELILHDHSEQRRLFSYLDDVDRDDTATLEALWTRLRILLEVHAAAEEELFYPHLLRIGTGAGGEPSVEAEVTDVIKDHNEIRDACAEVERHEVGSEGWWDAVAEAREANSDHMAEEEREDLPDFRLHADLAVRHEIAVAFARFEAEHAEGVRAKDRDPQEYVERAG
ncbi:MAG: cation-binding protein [Frankiales bacterium]|nr:cation-binding protein [Frankiales bacterium]